jgi:DUF971 family protein
MKRILPSGYDRSVDPSEAPEPAPRALHLDRQRGLHVTFNDGTVAFLSLALLRRMSPSADARTEREAMAKNPLHVLSPRQAAGGPLTATTAELVGNYAVRIRFSDGHDTGLYAWKLLRELAAQAPESQNEPA